MAETPEDRLVARIRAYRRAQGWSQAELAREVATYGIAWNQTTVARIETRKRGLSLNEGAALLQLFEITPEGLLATAPEVPETPSTDRIREEIEQITKDIAGAEARIAAHTNRAVELNNSLLVAEMERDYAVRDLRMLRQALTALETLLKP